MKPTPNIQDQILKALKENGKPVTLSFLDGTAVMGTVVDYDSFTVLLQAEKKLLIYKHALAFLQLDD